MAQWLHSVLQPHLELHFRHSFTSFSLVHSLLQQLVELRGNLSQLLRHDIKEQKLRLQETTESASKRHGSEVVDGDVKVDSDLSDWLSDCVDRGTINKVCAVTLGIR